MSSTYADLEAWRAAMDFVVRVYQLSKKFPKGEIYGLTGRIRRAAVSSTEQHRRRQGAFLRSRAHAFLVKRAWFSLRDRDTAPASPEARLRFTRRKWTASPWRGPRRSDDQRIDSLSPPSSL